MKFTYLIDSATERPTDLQIDRLTDGKIYLRDSAKDGILPYFVLSFFIRPTIKNYFTIDFNVFV